MDLFEEIGKKKPKYALKYKKLMESFARKGAVDQAEAQESSYDLGKFFNTQYELYIYAAFLGLSIDNPLPIENPDDGKGFLVVREWKPEDVVHYLIMCVFAKSKIDFNDLEDMDELGVEREMRAFSKLLEAYANGGLDYLNGLLNKGELSFDDDYCFVKLLKSVAEKQAN
jgi:hypothetical protein